MRLFLVSISMLVVSMGIAQDLSFAKTVDQFFFGVNVFKSADSVIADLSKVSKLNYAESQSRQWSLNVEMEMKDSTAFSTNHLFYFTKDPLNELKIDSGLIKLRIGETESKIKKILDIDWKIEFKSERDAHNYFKRMKQLFAEVATLTKEESNDLLGLVYQASTRKRSETGVRDIMLSCGKSFWNKNYIISLSFGNDFLYNNEYP